MLCASIQAQIPQSSNLVGEYKFTGNSDDSSGNSYDGQTYGGPTLTQDRFGNNNSAYSLDGTDDYIHFDNNMLSEWNTTNGWVVESFSISFWAKSSVSTEEPIIAFGVHNNGNLYGSNSLYKGMITRFGTTIKMNSNNWPTYSNNSGFSTLGRTYDGQWHHYVLVWNYDTGYRQAYIDGSLVGQFRQVESGNIRKRFAIRDKALSIGRERYENDGSTDDPGLSSAGTYTGSVDEVRIWNLALSSSEISNLYSYDNTSSNYTPETFTNSSGDNQWDTPSNWSSGSMPTSSTDVTISSGQTIEVGSSATAVANNITVDSGGSLTIAKNSDFTISGNFTNNGTVTLNSDADEFASIIVGGTSSGDIIYNRYVNTQGTDEWDLIGAPVDGLSISSFVTANSSPLAASGSTYAVGVYDNSDGSWTNYTSSTVGAAGNFDIGKGYQMATASGATMAFTGTIATTDQTQSIINNAGSGGSRWNLVANPYPSYLNANTSAHATNNFLSVNSGVIDNSYLAVYGYDADGTGYTIYNNTSSATHIAPGQAFFVAAASSSSASLSFTEAMQTTTGGDDFIVGLSANTSSTFYLKLYEDQDFIADTRFYFDSNLTLGLDPGYDAGSLSQSTTIGSRLVEEDQGITIGINAMGIDSLEEVTIPLVINRAAGVAFRVSLEGATIPQGTKVYLEDTQQATFTDLRAGDFTLNPQSELSGMGRFYLRLGSIALSVDELEDSNISVYKQKAEKHITIEGLDNVTKASVKLYNLLGQELLRQDLEANIPTQKISTAGITTGVYVVKLSVNGKKITKKVIVD
jgi:hypothetical protein